MIQNPTGPPDTRIRLLSSHHQSSIWPRTTCANDDPGWWLPLSWRFRLVEMTSYYHLRVVLAKPALRQATVFLQRNAHAGKHLPLLFGVALLKELAVIGPTSSPTKTAGGTHHGGTSRTYKAFEIQVLAYVLLTKSRSL